MNLALGMNLAPLADQDCASFSCGNDSLDDFLRTKAGQHQKKGVSKTYIRIDDGIVVGFVTMTVRMVKKEELGAALKKYPPFPMPSLLLARLGVSLAVQKKGVGKSLLIHVLRTARQLRDLVGCIGVWVDSKPEAVGWYKDHGFEPLGQPLDGLTPMFLPMIMIPSEPPSAPSTPSGS